MINWQAKYVLNQLPIEGLRKFSDLIEFEGPILSHFKDAAGRDYLFYWVDDDADVVRWIVWSVQMETLVSYLDKKIGLYDMMRAADGGRVFVVDMKHMNALRNVGYANLEDLPNEYLPVDNLPYAYDIPQAYVELIGEEPNFYLTRLRERALVFEMRPKDRRFSTTVEMGDAGMFLRRLDRSFRNFAQDDFFQKFKSRFGDFNRMKRTMSDLMEIVSPRIVSLEFRSFVVGISSDNIHRPDDSSFSEWQEQVLLNYQREVVDLNYNDSVTVEAVVAKYSEEARAGIFGPFIDILNDSNYQIQAYSRSGSFRRELKPVDEIKELQIVPKAKRIKDPESKVLVSLILEVPSNQDLEHISKKALSQGLLFSQVVDEARMSIHELHTDEYRINLSTPLEYVLRLEGDRYRIELSNLAISVVGTSREDVQRKLVNSFVKKYLESRDPSHAAHQFATVFNALGVTVSKVS